MDGLLRSLELRRQPYPRNFAIRSSKSIAPCGWGSTGNSAPLNFGTRPGRSHGRAYEERRSGAVAANVEKLLAGKKSWYADDPPHLPGAHIGI